MCVTCIQFRFRWARTWWESTTPIKGHSKIWFINGRRHVLFSLRLFNLYKIIGIAGHFGSSACRHPKCTCEFFILCLCRCCRYTLTHWALISFTSLLRATSAELCACEWSRIRSNTHSYIRSTLNVYVNWNATAVDWDAVGTQCVSVHICAIRALAVVRSLAEINKIQFAKQ